MNFFGNHRNANEREPFLIPARHEFTHAVHRITNEPQPTTFNQQPTTFNQQPAKALNQTAGITADITVDSRSLGDRYMKSVGCLSSGKESEQAFVRNFFAIAPILRPFCTPTTPPAALCPPV